MSELLQNADDNKYSEGTIPEVVISLFTNDSTLQLQCNETGFEKTQVEALCRSAHSSKTRDPPTIGEKGIGFKSVFKVATVATIRSKAYSFEFDTRKLGDYGMIVPTWVPKYPNPKVSDGTLLTLRLKKGWDRKALDLELKSFDFACLLFTRNLSRIKISIDGDVTEKSITKGSLPQYTGHVMAISTKSASKTRKADQYILVQHTVDGMLWEEKRASADKSEIILAFPVRDGMPWLENQRTYAYLPIRDLGFEVCLPISLTRHELRADQTVSHSRGLHPDDQQGRHRS